jgi:hypothetical protein
LEKEKIIDLSTLTITEYSTRICSYWRPNWFYDDIAIDDVSVEGNTLIVGAKYPFGS